MVKSVQKTHHATDYHCGATSAWEHNNVEFQLTQLDLEANLMTGIDKVLQTRITHQVAADRICTAQNSSDPTLVSHDRQVARSTSVATQNSQFM